MLPYKFSNTVKYNHRIIQGIPNHRQYGGNECLINFHAKGHEFISKRKDSQYDQYIMENSGNCSEGELPFSKSQQDIQEHYDQRTDDG